uniref:FlgO family outer membrane protein n=1 Tax=Candidatus Electronema sp. TaxID=2698783 RepID=UPI00405693DD
MSKKIRSLSVCGAAMFLSLLVSSAFGYEKEIEQLSAQMAEKITGKGKKTVAVVDFTDLEGNVTQLDQFIAEEFSVALASAGKGFRVIDRTRLKSIIKENKLAATGLIDLATASKLGKIAGVDALVIGTLTPFGDNVRLTVKVLDSETADIIDSAKSNFAKTQAIDELLGKEVAQEKPATERSATATKKTDRGYATQEVKGFTFNVKECKKSGEFLTCSVSATSNNKDKEIGIWANNYAGRTVLYDDIGNEYTASKIVLGEQWDEQSLSRRLVAGVPTIASFEFKGINQSANMVALFEITCRAEDERFAVQFRNVPISK